MVVIVLYKIYKVVQFHNIVNVHCTQRQCILKQPTAFMVFMGFWS